MFCSKCGAQIDSDATVCPNCHSTIEKIENPGSIDARSYYTRVAKIENLGIWAEVFGTIGFVLAVLYPLLCLIADKELHATDLSTIVVYSAGFGLALSLIGQKKNAHDQKCKNGFLMSVIALALIFVINFIYYTAILF